MEIGGKSLFLSLSSLSLSLICNATCIYNYTQKALSKPTILQYPMNEFRFALLTKDFIQFFFYCVAFSLSTWQTSNSHADSTPLTEQVLQDLMKYLQMSRYKDEDCVMTAPPYTPNNGDGWNISKNEIKSSL